MKKFLSFALKIIISGGLLWFFLSKMDIQSVGKTLSQTNILLFIIGFIIYLFTVFVSTKRWALFLPESIKYSKLVSLYFIGAFFSTLLPGLVSGDAVKAFYLYKHTGKGTGGSSFASVFMDRYMGFTAMVFIAMVGFIGGYRYIKGTEIVWASLAFIGGFLIGSIVLWFIDWGRIKALGSFYESIMEFKTEKKILINGLLFGFAVQFLYITCVYVLSRSIGLDVSIFYFFIFLPLVGVASSIPISIAGLGIREAAFVILFGKVGVAEEIALSLSLLSFIVMCMISLIGGVEYLRVGKPKEAQAKS